MGKPQPIHESVQAKYKDYTPSQRKKTTRRSRRFQQQNSKDTTIAPQQRTRYSSHGNKKGVLKTRKSKKRRNRAVRKGLFIILSLAWFYPIQLFFAFLFVIAMTAATSEGWIAWLTQDIALGVMMVSWVMNFILGTGFMIYAIMAFSTSRIKLWKDPKTLLVFGVCIWGYWAPIVFFFPWVVVFIAYVIYSQRRT